MGTYFITGGYGFLGQYIVQAVHDYDATGELRVLIRSQRKTRLNLEKLDRITWTRGELTKPETFADTRASRAHPAPILLSRHWWCRRCARSHPT